MKKRSVFHVFRVSTVLILLLAGIPATATIAKAETTYHLRVHAVLTANDDGSKAATITPEQVQNQIDNANDIWAGAHVVFDFDPADDIFTVNQTSLNNDCTIKYFINPLQRICSKRISATARDAYALNPIHDGAIVTFFRSGDSTITCADFFTCTNDAPSKAYSSRAGHFVVMFKGDPGNDALWAHEVGHYLWNTHTFRSSPDCGGLTGAECLALAEEAIHNYVDTKGNPKSTALLVFDGNTGEGDDTPPDPGRRFWSGMKGSKCATGPGSGTQSVTVDFDDGSSQTYSIAPDRTNVMSYFHCSALGFTSSSDQQDRVRAALEDWNRGQLIGKTPSYAALDEEWRADWAGGHTIIMPFTSRYQEYLFLYDGADGDVKIVRLSETPKDTPPVTVWTGSFSTGYTSFSPFELDDTPYALIYKRDSGTAKIIRIPPEHDGVETVYTGSWTTGYTSLLPFTYRSRTDRAQYALLYKKDTGAVKAVRIADDGSSVATVWTGDWNHGYTSMMPFRVGSSPAALLYKTGNGFVKTVRFNAQGQGVTTLWSDTWTTGWMQFAPFTRGPQARYVAVKPATGEVDIDRILPDGKGTVTMEEYSWSSGWTHVIPVRRFAGTDLFIYKVSDGTAAIESITQ